MKMRGIKLLALMTTALLVGCETKTPANIVTSYSFDEGQGEATSNTVSNESLHINYVFNQQNQSQLYKLASDPLWYEAGISNGALLFDGYSTYIEDSSVELPTEAITISAWVAPRAFEWGDGGNLSSFVSQSNKEAVEGINFGMYKHGTWGLQLGVGDDLLSQWIEIWDNGHQLPTNEWSHVMASYDTETATAKLYLNGKKISEEVFTNYIGKPIKTSDENLIIGKSNNNVRIVGVFDVNMFNGLMDEVVIYDQALNDEEIKEIFNSSLEQYNGMIPEIEVESLSLDPELYATDRYRPQYHAMPGGYWMNEPHAPIYYNGKYHLFYQHNPFGPFWHQIHWGHWVSDDMVNWENVEIAISPTAGDITPDGVWTGCATYDENGVPVLFFTAGNDGKTPNQSIGLARPKDPTDPYLTEWEIYEDIIVEQQSDEGDFGEFRDPFVWKEETGEYFMLVASGTNNGNGGTALIYSSSNLFDWEFRGNIYESDYSQYKLLGEHWELPVLLPVKSEDGTVEKDVFIISPHGKGADVEVFYWLGHFDPETARFIPEDEEPKLLDYGDGIFTGPSGFVDVQTGKTILFTIAQGADRSSWEDYYSGWAHTAGLPIELALNDEGQLIHKPIEQTELLREQSLVDLENIGLEEANEALSGIKGDMLEIILEIENVNASSYGIQVRKAENNTEFTSIYYDLSNNDLVVDRLNSSMNKTGLGVRKAPLSLEDETLKLHLFLDRSLLEVYCNDTVGITTRIYPSIKDSMGLELISTGEVIIKNLEVYQMKSIFVEETQEPYYEY